MPMEKLRYSNWTIALQEVPGEISIVINVTGCPHHCEDCHSSYLGEEFGSIIEEDFDSLLKSYKNYVTCVCFMGGDQKMGNLMELLKKSKEKGFKTCVYSGADAVEIFKKALPYLDFLKIGRYDARYGPLNSPNTNQRFYSISEGKLTDNTSLFWRKYF